MMSVFRRPMRSANAPVNGADHADANVRRAEEQSGRQRSAAEVAHVKRCCRDQLEQREEDREREAAHQEEARREDRLNSPGGRWRAHTVPAAARDIGSRPASSLSRLRQTKMRTMPTSVRLMDSPAQSPMTPQPRPNAAKAASGKADEPVADQVGQHGGARVAQPSQCARRHALQAVEQLERRRDAQQRDARRDDGGIRRVETDEVPGHGKKRESPPPS